MAFQAVARRSLSDAVFEQLSGQIFGGELQAGEALPPERELCAALGVNRGAVREALKRLDQAGLIAVRHGGGSTVLDYRRTGGLSLLPQLLFRDQDRIDFDVARSVIELRAALGPDMARLCALRATAELIARLEASRDTLAACGEDVGARQLVALELWDLIAEGSDNIAYQLAFNSLRETYDHIRELLAQALAEEVSADDLYRALVKAIADRDADRAFDVARKIIELGGDAVLALIYLLRGMAQESK